MWVYDPQGRFYSAVAHREQTDLIVVRSRLAVDAEHLARYCDRLNAPSEIVVYDASDYPVRVITTKYAWAAFLHDLAQQIDYPNYKAHVAERGAAPVETRMVVLHDVWAVNLTLQHGLPADEWDDEPDLDAAYRSWANR